MVETVKFLLVKPTVLVEDLSLKIEPRLLGIETVNTSLKPIQFNLLSSEMAEAIRAFKQKVFEDLADSAITLHWSDEYSFFFEDAIEVGFPHRRHMLNEVRFNDFLYFMTEPMLKVFKKRFSGYREEFEKLIDDITASYDEMIDDSIAKIISDFPSVKDSEKDLRKSISNKESFRNSSGMDYILIDVWLKKSDMFIKLCLRQAELTASTVTSPIIRYLNNEDKLRLYTNHLGKAIQRMEKYNVTNDKTIRELIEHLKKLNLIYENPSDSKVLYDVEELLDNIIEKSI